MKKESNSSVLIIVLFIGVIVVFLFPKIYSIIEKTTFPEVEKSKGEVKEEKKELTDEIINEIHSPIMRNSIYSDFTYYSLDTFKVTDMKNSDILYNAFSDIYEGNIVNSSHSSSCGSVNKELNAKYIDLRIKNILGRDLTYNHESFYVPEDSNSNYKGNWIYSDSVYYFDGMCNSVDTSVRYYDLTSRISADYINDDDISIKYYVGFAKVVGNKYYIYSDSNMTNEVLNGDFIDYDTLKTAFENMEKSKLKKYQYIYKNTLCTYDEYCMYEGKWINE